MNLEGEGHSQSQCSKAAPARVSAGGEVDIAFALAESNAHADNKAQNCEQLAWTPNCSHDRQLEDCCQSAGAA
jgi:hypothetical protein